MESNRFWRQLDICPPEKLQFPITVIGAGAIGSAAVITLAKMGCGNITVYDHDLLEEHNLPNQFALVSCLGQSKVEALKALVGQLAEVEIRGISERYRGQRLGGIVICAVDSMEARGVIWKTVKGNLRVQLHLDARMGAEVLRLYTIRPTDADGCALYEANLYTSGDAERLPCSARAIVYCPLVAGALIALQVKRFAVDQHLKKEVLYDLTTLNLIAT
jgi:glycine/D-amino acid oxidase-like deaminating enzyme